MSTTITVYQSRKSLRVVAGEHKPHADSKRDRVAVYPSARLAYSTETDIAVQMAILRIDPTAADGSPVSTFKPAKPTRIFFNTGRQYSGNGQRIAADHFKGGVLFVDLDRGIEGHIPAPIPLTETAIMARYDANDYRQYVQGVSHEEFCDACDTLAREYR